MKLKMFQVDAFANHVFEGNPAAVCPLETWLDDSLLQAIAEENNLSETAFFVPMGNAYELRWFTPADEVDLCGHATLAAAHVLYTHLHYTKQDVVFLTRSGPLTVTRSGTGFCMDFPAASLVATEAPSALVKALGKAPKEVLSGFDYLVVFDSEEEIKSLKPDFEKLKELGLRGVVVTAPGHEVDFVSRCFFPKLRVNEDPVTGSAHCELAPYWASRLGRNKLSARQLSKRSGSVECEVKDNRVFLSGNNVEYMVAEVNIPQN
ncbi:PhzF family phenazine biosynthesis protein [Alteromonas mediterranea]|uniref:PhzF family phenazine biosynthesis protein n=1 Tax=Alteromonas mediterranea 615 TaxID=1300253 RepID=S5ACM3_9ALTE|nr:PhzF family phenazine biosynthesis protein [Alteromonas mediterranea]AGP77992.1 PhzF family phenazine biosynthesis protein [Alteromonas mediterranea 615]AGP89712.1 PhzF family phenazine biosynthesis protein [Alteromonas mediterranea U7]